MEVAGSVTPSCFNSPLLVRNFLSQVAKHFTLRLSCSVFLLFLLSLIYPFLPLPFSLLPSISFISQNQIKDKHEKTIIVITTTMLVVKTTKITITTITASGTQQKGKPPYHTEPHIQPRDERAPRSPKLREARDPKVSTRPVLGPVAVGPEAQYVRSPRGFLGLSPALPFICFFRVLPALVLLYFRLFFVLLFFGRFNLRFLVYLFVFISLSYFLISYSTSLLYGLVCYCVRLYASCSMPCSL